MGASKSGFGFGQRFGRRAIGSALCKLGAQGA
jgi:hypothetical protein